jgi:hypothetical protein
VQSFYITTTNNQDPAVSCGVGVNQYGQVYASNSDMDVVARGGVFYAFGGSIGASGLLGVPPSSNAGRLWRGAVRYCVL